MIPFGAGLNASIHIAQDFGQPVASAAWVAAAYP